jgi:Flp pilus assembly protein TadG
MQAPLRFWKSGPGLYLRPPLVVRRFSRGEDGATGIEFAMLAVPFFVLLFGIIESSLIFFAGQMLESAVDGAGRNLRTGELDNASTAAAFRNALCQDATALFTCSKIKIDVQVADEFIDLGDPPLPDNTNSTSFSSYSFTAPCPQEVVMVTASYEWPIFTYFVSDNIFRTVPGSTKNPLFRKILLNAIAVFRTENFPAATGGRVCT